MFKLKKKDNALLSESGDRIDNAVFALTIAILRGDDDVDTKLAAAAEELSVERGSYESLPDDTKAKIRDTLIPIVRDRAEWAHLDDPTVWNMGVIGGSTDILETLLVNNGVKTCHPWQDEKGHICYSLCSRCSHCRH